MMRLLLLATALTVTLTACDRKQPQPAAKQPEQPTVPAKGLDRSRAGQPLPDSELNDPEGETTTLAAEAGEPILVNLWATWCAPCVKELPTLEALGERDGAPRVIAVSQDIAPRGSVDAFLGKHGLEALEVWHDPEMRLSGALDAEILPTTILFDADGREVWRYVGDLDWTGKTAERLLTEGR